MSKFLVGRAGRRRLAVLAVGLAALAGSASIAVGGLGSAPDGGPASSEAGGRVLNETRCGPDIGEIVRTENAQRTKKGSDFVAIPGATVSFSVPSGQSRCVKVLLTAEAACSADPGATDDFCYVRALDNGVEMLPQGGGFQALASEDATAEAHAYEWVRRVGAGVHNIAIQWRTDGGNTVFFLDDWTVDVKITS